MSERKVPELSLLSFVNGSQNDQIKFIDSLFSGIKDYGFIILKDHIVDQGKINLAYELTHEYFSLEKKIKNQYVLENGGQRGHTAFGTEHAKGHDAVDLKEFWHVGRDIPEDHKFKKYYPNNVWPQEIKEFQKTMSELYGAMDETSKALLEALGIALDVPRDFFASMIKDGNSILRLIHYPPLDQVPNRSDDSVRAAAHGDINLITLLVGATDSGLQLLDNDGSWLDVNSSPGEIVVDSGDMLSRITNEIIPSTIHRVINPKDESSTRYSMPYFVHPHPEAQLKCISSCLGEGEKYPPISAHEFLMIRLREIGLT
jgi:isopenicillin N synthase-like dioxygenase